MMWSEFSHELAMREKTRLGVPIHSGLVVPRYHLTYPLLIFVFGPVLCLHNDGSVSITKTEPGHYMSAKYGSGTYKLASEKTSL